MDYDGNDAKPQQYSLDRVQAEIASPKLGKHGKGVNKVDSAHVVSYSLQGPSNANCTWDSAVSPPAARCVMPTTAAVWGYAGQSGEG